MIKKIVIITVISLFMTCTFVFSEVITGNNISLRLGKGAFFPVVSILNKGDNVKILKETPKWKEVKTKDGKKGWVSSNAFNVKTKKIDYGLMAQDTSQMNVSRIMVSAAVKGFFENRINDTSLNKKLFKNPYVNYIEPSGYLYFLKSTFLGRPSHESFMRENIIGGKTKNFVIDENLYATSAYIVGRLTAPGVTQNSDLSSYVNHVARLIVDSTEYYDLPVSVHIARTDKIFANSTPIGVIVISQGMLKILRNESELACLLGHEISHVTLSHGATESKIRKPKFAAEDAFAELGDELGVDDMEKELDEMCVAMYERAIRGRTSEYESAADVRGMLYARRAGYDPKGLITLLSRIRTLIPASRNPEERTHWLPASIDKRIKIAEKNCKSSSEYLKFKERLLQHVR